MENITAKAIISSVPVATQAHDWFALLAPGIVPGVAALISSALSLLVAVYAVRMTKYQNDVARDRLRLDLFGRRYKVWQRVRDGVRDYQSALMQWRASNYTGDLPSDTARLDLARNDTLFLFGEDVQSQINTVKGAINVLISTLDEGRGLTGQALLTVHRRNSQALTKIDEEQERLLTLMGDYMSLADVGKRPT